MSEWITFGVLLVCGVTDLIWRRTSELLIVIGMGTILWVHFSWLNLFVGGILSLLWLYGVLRNEAGLGDLEMSALLGVGYGVWGVAILFISLILAYITKPLWPRLATKRTPLNEKTLAPIGVYCAASAGVFQLLFAVHAGMI